MMRTVATADGAYQAPIPPPDKHGRAVFPIAAQFASVYAFGLVLALALAFFAYRSTDSLLQAFAQVRPVREAVDNLDDILQALTDAETAQRGFIITGDASYLTPFEQAQARLPKLFETLSQSITTSDRYLPGALAKISALATDKFKELRETIELRRLEPEAAVTRVRSNRGKILMDQLRDTIGTLRGIEANDLEKRRVSAAEQSARLQQVALFGSGCIVLVSTLVGVAMTRRINRRIRNLADATRQIGSGRLDFRIDTLHRDELDDLATDFNQMAERLKESQEALDSFAYTVSHDLRAPLRSMQGFSQALIEDCGDALDDEGRDYAERIAGAARRMDQLILDLLTYSRLTSIDVDFRTLALDDVVEKVLRELAADLEASSAIVSVDRPLPSVRANLTLLGQVLANLISNAVKFVAPGETPKVRISSITTQDSQGQAVVRLFVDDAGIGVPAEQQDRIFKTFERLHGIEVYPGTGIGLAIVRKAMQRLDGAVGVEPGPSGGSRFWVELPAAGES